MNDQNRLNAFCEKHPFEECNEEEYNKEKTLQIEFTYPKELRDCHARKKDPFN